MPKRLLQAPHRWALLCPNLGFASAPNPNPFAGARRTHVPPPVEQLSLRVGNRCRSTLRSPQFPRPLPLRPNSTTADSASPMGPGLAGPRRDRDFSCSPVRPASSADARSAARLATCVYFLLLADGVRSPRTGRWPFLPQVKEAQLRWTKANTG